MTEESIHSTTSSKMKVEETVVCMHACVLRYGKYVRNRSLPTDGKVQRVQKSGDLLLLGGKFCSNLQFSSRTLEKESVSVCYAVIRGCERTKARSVSMRYV